MKKRLVALMLGMIMIVSAMAGCGSDEKKPEASSEVKQSAESSAPASSSVAEAEKEEASEELAVDHFAGTEITVVAQRKGADTSENFNDKLIWKMVEEATGIHVNWIEVEAAVAGERLNVMLAEKEQPDVYLGMMLPDTMVANASMFYDLSEEGLLETYAPDVLAVMEEIKADIGLDIYEALVQTDGSIRGLATNSANSPTSDAQGITVINKTWLDKLGMEVPTTTDELYEVLCAFRDNDMNGNGIKDEIPMSFCNAHGQGKIWFNAGSFGFKGHTAYPYINVEDGKVSSTVDTEEWRAFLEYYHKLMAEGLVDAEGFSQAKEQFNAKIAENKVGVYSCWTPVTGEGMEFVVLPNVKALDGVEPGMVGGNGAPAFLSSGFIISKDSENVEAALHWWNYLHTSTDLMNTAYCGEKDVVWFQLEEDFCYDDTSTDEALANYNFNSMSNNGNPLRPLRAFTGKKGERFEMVEGLRDMMVNYSEWIPNRFVDSLKTEERTFMETDLFDYINNYAAEAIMDGVTDDSWNEYVDKLEDYQYYEWLNWYQEYLDGKF